MVNSNVCVDIFPEASATLSVMATNGEFNDLHSSLQTATPNFHFMSTSFTNQSNKNLKAHRHKYIYIYKIFLKFLIQAVTFFQNITYSIMPACI